MNESTDTIVAVVSTRSKGPISLFDSTVPITQENVGQFDSEEDDIHNAKLELAKLGFNVQQAGIGMISIEGSRKLFEEVFGQKLKKKRTMVRPEEEAEYFDAPGEGAEQLLKGPDALGDLIEGIAIAQPPELYDSPLPPLATVATGAYRYMFVPDEVAVITRAARVHRLGTTGKNIVVAMIDTGHTRSAHPFFSWHGYRTLATLLGPGATDPTVDSNGHGTGESANTFATAPDIRLRPIKFAADTTGAFNVAVSSTPKPQVITNSWGYDVDRPGATLSPYLRTLEAAVANAVASGIVVCFAAGNGQFGFPGSHPDVISVGGVHVNHPYESDNDLEASSYASSFASTFYPGRHVPDICGLTGKKATISGSTRAPSLMLPVPHGSSLDGISPPTSPADDGWGIFSGTSAACPQVAGVVALMLEKDPSLTPANVKTKILQSGRDVKSGTTQHGETATTGPDLATGAGLVDAKWSWLIAMSDVAGHFFEATDEERAQMLESGQMPHITKELMYDMIDTLRSR